MGIKRYAARKDRSQDDIVSALRKAGASVYVTSDKGLPDLIIGYQGCTMLAECKSKGGTLTDAQIDFMNSWRGNTIHILLSSQDAIDLLNGELDA